MLQFPFVPGYDLVGVVEELGAADPVPVPDGVSAVDAETLVVNGVTAWRMLHRTAKVRSGGTSSCTGPAGASDQSSWKASARMSICVASSVEGSWPISVN